MGGVRRMDTPTARGKFIMARASSVSRKKTRPMAFPIRHSAGETEDLGGREKRREGGGEGRRGGREEEGRGEGKGLREQVERHSDLRRRKKRVERASGGRRQTQRPPACRGERR